MITYELAKKLKDAGFPQGIKIGDNFYDNNGTRWLETIGPMGNIGTCAKDPTLSELVEACQEEFNSLVRNALVGGWTAYGTPQKKDEYDYAQSPTPEEAVANLYLAIKNNK